MIETSREIIEKAITDFKPIKVALLFSGGHDSLVCSHICANILKEKNIDFVVYHGDTTIGIPETQKYVKRICELFGWELIIRKPPRKDRYEAIVKRWGFPGPTKNSHQICYVKLKERALNKFVSHECKTSIYARENVLLLTGIRKQESKIRMGYIDYVRKENSKIWCSPIFYWSKNECEKYIALNNLPRNPVKDKICISGECLCGAFGSREEYAEIKWSYPHVAAEIDRLHEVAKKAGHPWPWGYGPTKWHKNNPPGQINMFMCVGCENKRIDNEAHTEKADKGMY